MKILIVDDNANERKFMKMNLKEHGIESIIEAGDGEEGLMMARTRKPDLIISDGFMPRMDGFQFLRSVKSDESLKSIHFIFYTAIYTGYQELELATSLGADAFIIKPKSPEELWKELCGFLDKCREENTRPANMLQENETFLKEYSSIITVKLEEKVRELSDEIRHRKKLEEDLKKLIASLRDSMAQVKTLRGMLPICASCKKVRDDKGYWNQIESYIRDHSELEFSHGLCPECYLKAGGQSVIK